MTAQGHASDKLEAVRNVLRLFREKKQVAGGEIMVRRRGNQGAEGASSAPPGPTPTAALDAVLFRMKRVDAHLDEVRRQQEAFRPALGHQVQIAPAPNQVQQLETLLGDVITNLKVLIEISGHYAEGSFAAITPEAISPGGLRRAARAGRRLKYG